jgi:hypothetical protein
MTHCDALPELTHATKLWLLPGASKEELTDAWREWVQQAGARPAGPAQPPHPRGAVARRPPHTHVHTHRACRPHAVEATGEVPPGNAPGEKKWQQRARKAARPELRLTSGKGLADLTCTLDFLVDQVVKQNRVRCRGGTLLPAPRTAAAVLRRAGSSVGRPARCGRAGEC